jgi:hypothetical protein
MKPDYRRAVRQVSSIRPCSALRPVIMKVFGFVKVVRPGAEIEEAESCTAERCRDERATSPYETL